MSDRVGEASFHLIVKKECFQISAFDNQARDSTGFAAKINGEIGSSQERVCPFLITTVSAVIEFK